MRTSSTSHCSTQPSRTLTKLTPSGIVSMSMMGAALFTKVDGAKMRDDFLAAARWLKSRPDSTGGFSDPEPGSAPNRDNGPVTYSKEDHTGQDYRSLAMGRLDNGVAVPAE